MREQKVGLGPPDRMLVQFLLQLSCVRFSVRSVAQLALETALFDNPPAKKSNGFLIDRKSRGQARHLKHQLIATMDTW